MRRVSRIVKLKHLSQVFRCIYDFTTPPEQEIQQTKITYEATKINSKAKQIIFYITGYLF